MKLSYFELLSYEPILLSIGSLKKPKLKDISELSYHKFMLFEFLLIMTPKLYYTKLLNKKNGEEIWNSFTQSQKEQLNLYQLILDDNDLKELYLEMFKFFFIESVSIYENYFVITKKYQNSNKIIGTISSDNLEEILEILQQICCIYTQEEPKEEKYKNKLAEKLDKQLKEAAEKNNNTKNKDYDKANIISAVCNKHPSLNYTNIWDITIFQLYDAFKRLKLNSVYEINATSVSVWGDENKEFNSSLWYNNDFI